MRRARRSSTSRSLGICLKSGGTVFQILRKAKGLRREFPNNKMRGSNALMRRAVFKAFSDSIVVRPHKIVPRHEFTSASRFSGSCVSRFSLSLRILCICSGGSCFAHTREKIAGAPHLTGGTIPGGASTAASESLVIERKNQAGTSLTASLRNQYLPSLGLLFFMEYFFQLRAGVRDRAGG